MISQESTTKDVKLVGYKKASWDVYQTYIAEHLPSFDVDALNTHQAARSFSLFLVEAAKASIPFGRLGRPPKAW